MRNKCNDSTLLLGRCFFLCVNNFISGVSLYHSLDKMRMTCCNYIVFEDDNLKLVNKQNIHSVLCQGFLRLVQCF